MPPRKTANTPVVFLAISSSEVGRYRALKELELEYTQLQALYESAERAGRCELVTRFAVTLDDILAVFQSQECTGRIAVFHFAGHAEEDLLVMQDAAGDPLLAGAKGLAGFLAAQRNLQLFFINGCRSEPQIAALHAGSIPVVIATREEIPDASAREFAVRFHRGLSTGATIADAFAAAQGAMQSATHEHAWRWDPELWLLSARSERDRQWKLGDRPHGEVPWRVPFLQNDSFVGREEDLRSLHIALTESSTVGIRPAGLTGMGGIGKTQLGVEYCYRYRDSYPGGVFWLNAAAAWRAEFADLGTYLEPELAGEPEMRRIRAAADYLKAHPDCLLVLDNVADPAVVGRPVTPELIPISLPCSVLLTTRSHDLGRVRPIEVTVLPEASALQLLLRAKARQPVLRPDHAEHADARAIYRMLGGLALALEIAGAFLEEWPEVSLTGFRQRLHREGRLATLDTEGVELPIGSMSGVHAAAVAATLGEQWDALSTGRQVDQDAQRLLRVASQLPEAAQIPAARLGLLSGLAYSAEAGVPGRLDRALRRLARACLLEELRADELRLHPLVREFAADMKDTMSRPDLRRACALNLLGAYQDVTELERQSAARGVDALDLDLQTALALLPSGEEAQPYRTMLQQQLRMLRQESHTLRGWNQAQRPALFLHQWHIRALISSEPHQAQAAKAAIGRRSIPYLVLLWTTASEFTALERTFIDHGGGPIRYVAVTEDGQRAVSASGDYTLKVWDLTSGAELHTLNGHTGYVRAVAVTPDGQRAVSASDDGTLKVWDLARGVELHTLEGPEYGVLDVAVTADGRRVVSPSWDHTLKVWDLESGAELHTLSGHTDSVNAVAVTPDGKRAVSASWDHTLKVWDLASGAELHTLSGHTSIVDAVTVTPDGRHAVSVSNETLKVWDLASGAELHTLAGHAHEVLAVAVTPDGQWAVSASRDHTLMVWDLASGAELHTLSRHTDIVWNVAVTPDGQRAVSASFDRTLKVWDLTSGAELHTLSGHTGNVNAVAVTADGRQAISASDDGTLKVWDLVSVPKMPDGCRHTDWVSAVAVTGDGQRAVSASFDRTLKVWDLASGTELHTLSGHTSSVNAVAVTPDGQRAVSASWDHTLKVWDLESGTELNTLHGHTGAVTTVAVTPDGRRAVSASRDNTLKLWDLATGTELHTLSGHTSIVDAVTVTPNGQRAVSASGDHMLKVWDLASGAELHTLSGHTSSVDAVAVTPDGQRAVSASGDHALKVWDLASGAETHTLSGHTSSVNAVAVTPDGQRAVSASWDHTLKVWDLESGTELHSLSGHSLFVNALSVAPDGRRAVSASWDHTLKVWDLATATLLTDITLDAAVECISFASDGVTIFAGDRFGNVHCLIYCECQNDSAHPTP